MTDREALQIAFNALVAIDRETPYPMAKHAIKCINETLRQAPSSKPEWVSLTDEERERLWDITPPEYQERFAFAKAIEAALKERNGG